MKKTYSIKLYPWFWAGAGLLAALLIAGLAFSAVNISRWNPADHSGYWLDILSIILISLLFIALVLIVFNSKYILDGARLRLMFGFFWFSIPLKDIKMIRTNPERSTYLIYFQTVNKKTGETKLPFIAVNSPNNTEMVEEILQRNDNIMFDIFEK